MKRVSAFLVLTFLLASLPFAASAADIHVMGADGVELTLMAPAQRVVALAPDLSELMFDVGAGDSLKGTVEYSDYPAAAKQLPRVGDAFHVDMEKLLSLKPDLVLVWQGGTPQPLIEKMRALKLNVLAIGTHELPDIASNLETLGIVTGHADAAQLAAQDFRTRLGALRREYADQAKLKVFYEISAQPLFTVGGGQSISRLIGVCGGSNIFADLTALAPTVSLEAVLARDPQVIATGDGEGDEQQRFKDWQRWPNLAATKQGNFVVLNDDWISRSTPRLLDAGKQLCEALQKIRDKR
ncbi:MAG TPA: cobalamin-binding protein [Gammaproteobacteria bacterium]|jgi:iron complex transport system substrate-binding protein